jgi:hypothetical protein
MCAEQSNVTMDNLMQVSLLYRGVCKTYYSWLLDPATVSWGLTGGPGNVEVRTT